MKGHVYRTPPTNGELLASGSATQLNELLAFFQLLHNNDYIGGYEVRPCDTFIADNIFFVRPSARKFITTGVYSDPRYDEVFSTSSADQEVQLGTRSPHGSQH